MAERKREIIGLGMLGATYPVGAMTDVVSIIERAERLSEITGRDKEEIIKQALKLAHTTILSPEKAMNRVEDELMTAWMKEAGPLQQLGNASHNLRMEFLRSLEPVMIPILNAIQRVLDRLGGKKKPKANSDQSGHVSSKKDESRT